MPTAGNGAIYNFDYSDSLTILIKAKIPDNYVHSVGDVNNADFLFTLRPYPDPKLGWGGGGGTWSYLEWRGLQEYTGYVTQPGDDDKYVIFSRHECLESSVMDDSVSGNWNKGTLRGTIFPIQESGKEYTFIFGQDHSSYR